MSDTDERIKRLERAATEWHAAWVAEPALEVIRERDQRIAELERWLAFTQRKHGEALDRAAAAERRAEALERALKDIADIDWYYTPTPRPGPNKRVRGQCGKIARAALTQQEPYWPAQDGGFGYSTGWVEPHTEQPADAGEPSCCARTRKDERERCAQIVEMLRRQGI
jgi:hypothetical protein